MSVPDSPAPAWTVCRGKLTGQIFTNCHTVGCEHDRIEVTPLALLSTALSERDALREAVERLAGEWGRQGEEMDAANKYRYPSTTAYVKALWACADELRSLMTYETTTASALSKAHPRSSPTNRDIPLSSSTGDAE